VVRAPEPEGFDIRAAVSVLAPDDVGVDAIKDPYVIAHEGEHLMYISTFLTPAGPAPTSLARSDDGSSFTWLGEALAVAGAGNWDAYQARLSCIVPWGGGFVAYYDGAASPADDTEEHAGIACSLDLARWARLSIDGPRLCSPHATKSLRYIDAIDIGGAWWAYYEYARADGSHELRRSRLEMQ
jgi:hypothetical protein